VPYICCLLYRLVIGSVTNLDPKVCDKVPVGPMLGFHGIELIPSLIMFVDVYNFTCLV
jgi:hypothetical protein